MIAERIFRLVDGVRLSGIDLSMDMIKNNECLDRYDVLTLGDAIHLPFEKNRFDAVFSTFMLHHSLSIYITLKEMYRILQKGGTAVVVDFTILKNDKDFNVKHHTETEEYGALSNYVTEEELVCIFRTVGFDIVKVKNIGKTKSMNHTMVVGRKNE